MRLTVSIFILFLFSGVFAQIGCTFGRLLPEEIAIYHLRASQPAYPETTPHLSFDVVKEGICNALPDTVCAFYSFGDFFYFWKTYFGTDRPFIDFNYKMAVLIKQKSNYGVGIENITEGLKRLYIKTTLWNPENYGRNNTYVLLVLDPTKARVKLY